MEIGEKLFGRYGVMRLLGKGAQSEVFLVRDEANQNQLKAAKVFSSKNISSASRRDLANEFHILESLQHPNLVRVYDYQLLDSSRTPVVITEFVDRSETAESVWSDAVQSWPLRAKVRFVFRMIDALAYLHRKKVIHGDLKPSNILLQKEASGEDWIPKMIDFGVSQDLLIDKKKSAQEPLII